MIKSGEAGSGLDRRIAIVGGGAVGPTAEQLFRVAGFTDVTTYEAASEPEVQTGGLLGLGPTALLKLHRAGIMKSELAAFKTEKMRTVDVIDPDQNETQEWSSGDHEGVKTTWDVFRGVMTRQLDIQYGKRVEGISPTDNGVELSFRDETNVEADLVVFADGRRSVGRAALDPARTPTYRDYVIWRGMTPAPKDASDSLSFYVDFEKRGVLFAVSDPITRGSNRGKIDWSLYQNISSDEFKQLTGCAPTQRSYLPPRAVTTEMRSYMAEYARGRLGPELAAIAIQTEDIAVIPVHDLPDPKQAVWDVGGGQAVLLGDALTTVRSHAARGLNNGIEQAASLVDTLAADPGNKLRAWEKTTLDSLGKWVKLGKDRARGLGLGTN